MLPTRSPSGTTQEVSQNECNIRAPELESDDPRLPDLQSPEHAEHVRMALIHQPC
ncbi:hypothetical protein PCASD_12199 [Puccinia coronata f. sp. avenae]|uniref:Uncharacterized protein n=1 Tax=Puccinia coronata f. sp. avenae TaxID=200324 RepID=A0A2N5UIW8_9BASI|nr:hypothetical protein PCASD_12199 [Puccinia coronata f. sp. avenae]